MYAGARHRRRIQLLPQGLVSEVKTCARGSVILGLRLSPEGSYLHRIEAIFGNGNGNPRGTVFERISHQRAHVSERLGKNPDKAPQGWVRLQTSHVASSNREPQQQTGRGGSQAPTQPLVVLEEEEVQSQARVPMAQRLGPQVPEAGEFQDLRQQIQEMQRKINRGRVFTTQTNTPLAPEIFAKPYPQGFKVPFFRRYDGESDPQEHINSYVQQGRGLGESHSGRIDPDLGLRFLEHFARNCRPKKHFTHLASVRQKHEESLKNFLVRWRKESREVEGTDDKSRLAIFMAALQDGLLHTDLTTHPPDTFEEAMVHAGRYVTLEERKEEKKEKTPMEEEKAVNKKSFKNKKQGFPDGLKGTKPGTSEKFKSANPVFTLPVAEVMAHAAQQGLMTYPTYSQKVCNVEDTGKWCAYHRKNDHNTEDCYTLKNEMARLIRRGHLKKFVQDGDGGNPGNAQSGKRREGHVAQAEAREKRHTGRRGTMGVITSSVGTLVGIWPQVGKKWASAAMVNKVVAPAQLEDELFPIKAPLTGFTGKSIEPEGVVTLPVEIGDTKATQKLDMEFVVVGIVSNTNVIMGRPGLEYLECVISPRHLCIKFPTPRGLGVARGSQRVSRAWHLKATKQPIRYNTQVGEVTAQLLRAEERRPGVEVAGDIEEVELEPSMPGRLVRIGKGLGAELRSRVISVLRRFSKVFAWSPADMPGLDHKIAIHRLNVLQDSKPVKQKRRHLSQERRDFVKKETVSTLIVREENGAQHPVYYVSKTLRDAELRFLFRVSHKEAEYEALINGMKILSKLGVSRVQVYSDSRLVVGQISGEFEAKEERMKRYRDLPLEILGKFEYKLEHIPRGYNAEADVLSKLSAESPEYISKLATVEELETPSINRDEVLWLSADPPEWLDRLARYIEDGVAPEDPQEARLLRMRAPTYKVQEGILYKRSYNGVLLRCLRAAEAKTLMEEIHEGDCEEYLRKCPTCQQFQNIPGRPATNYTPISSVIPFSMRGIDIVGALPKGIGQARWIVVAIDYFTKWVEADPLAGITGEQMTDFVGTNILCRIGVPKQIISNNGTQFEEVEFQDYLKTWGIQHTKVSVAYPQANGQVENVNRMIISGIKKKLLSEGSKWVDELPRILWTYRTTPRRATGDTPFCLAYGFEAWAPAEMVIPTRREITYDPEVNE
ncbi:unnamed protein product [Cuscuta campestris]|uniref:Integrase catalytic domain-containing protein n=1 Tax=Cuscuta campestris TaxID=132261 RepID=A0A484M0E2_9ASTE|nr:unnamed protein product [Cuscuta campestris]